MFLMLNVAFMTLEVTYGYLSNSLSLISDSIHMLVDSMALFIGLGASYISKRASRDKSWSRPFGYMKVESLSALVNSLFIISVGYNLFVKSADRLINP